MIDPFRIAGPAVVSFSGGRTSAYMLHRILDAYDGQLPADVVVCFANTGREMPATLDFVRDVGSHWAVPVVWLEYRWEPGRHYYAVVSHNSASRAGEPFEMLMAAKRMLPNPVMRFCTQDLKIQTIRRYLRAEMGWRCYASVVGLRADEMDRVERLRARDTEKLLPLADDGVTAADVGAFWRQQPFDLGLAGPWEGNCDGCFLKGRGSIERMLLDHPARMAWWSRAERLMPSTVRTAAGINLFRADRDDYATMADTIARQGRLNLTREETFGPCDHGGCGT